MDATVRYSKRVRNNKTYVTIKADPGLDTTFNRLVAELCRQYPTIQITSGSGFSVTGVVNLFEVLKKE